MHGTECMQLGIFKRGRALFRGLELGILDYVCATTEHAVGRIIQTQITHACMVQRLARGKEVNVYYSRRRAPPPNSVPRIRNTPIEFCLSTVFVAGPGLKNYNCCSIWVVNGLLFSLEFQLPPRHRRQGAGGLLISGERGRADCEASASSLAERRASRLWGVRNRVCR